MTATTSACSLGADESRSVSAVTMEGYFKVIMKDLKAIQFELKEIKTAVSIIETSVLLINKRIDNIETTKTNLPSSIFKLPAESIDDLRIIEEACNDEVDRLRLVRVMVTYYHFF